MSQVVLEQVRGLLNTVENFIIMGDYTRHAWEYAAMGAGVELGHFMLYVSAVRGAPCSII